MSNSLKVLFVPIDAVGHVNACIGIAQVLKTSGHTVVFVVSEHWKGKFEKLGFEEFLYYHDEKVSNLQFKENQGNPWADIFLAAGAISGSELETTISIKSPIWRLMGEGIKRLDIILDQLLKELKPDVVFLDQTLTIPSVILSGIPWVLVCSMNPLWYLEDERTPPGGSGLASKGQELECKKFRDAVKKASFETWQNWNQFIISRGVKPLEMFSYFHNSPFLNIYGFPLELDYTDIRPLPPKWYRFDNLKRTEKHSNFEIPEELRGKPGKLIYFSMGTLGTADVELMKRLVAILSKSKHRFIVAKGVTHDQYELAENMWGQQSVPQIQVLPLVDLVITHGGNNTVTETFFFGKPMIVIPLFADQNDNAQRIHEKGFGIRLNAYECSSEELLNGIESLLNDKQLNEKLKNISKRIQTDNSIAKLPQLIENLVKQ